MLIRIAEKLRHAFRPRILVGLHILGRANFSFCHTTLLAHTRPAYDTTPPQPLQNHHDPDEAQLKAGKRKKHAEYKRRWLEKKREDTVWREKYRQRHIENVKRYVRKKSKDEVWKHEFMDVSNEATRRWRLKIFDDDASTQQYMAKQRISDLQGYAASYDRRRHHAIRNWFWTHKDKLDTFVWKRWRPLCLPESVARVCATCRSRSKRGNRRLWFVKKSDPASWDCLPCFCSSDLSDVVPIQGAERFYNGKYLQPQSTGVEDIDRQADTQESVVRKEDEVKVHEREDVTVKEEQKGDHKPQQP